MAVCWAGIPVGCCECACSLWLCCRCAQGSPAQTSTGLLWLHCCRCARSAPRLFGRRHCQLTQASPGPLWCHWRTQSAPGPFRCSRPRHALPLSRYWASVSGSAPVGGTTGRLLSARRGFRAALPPQGFRAPKVPLDSQLLAKCARTTSSSYGVPVSLRLAESTCFSFVSGRQLQRPAHRFCFSVSLISSTPCTLCLCSGCGFLELVV